MTVVRKFLFDIDFEDEKPPAEEVEDIVEYVEPEVIEPVFKGYNLEISYDAGFDDGREEGIRESSSAIQQQVSETLKIMMQNLSEIYSIQEKANADAARDAMTAALAVARKVLPTLGERDALGEVERMIEMTIKKVIDEPRIVVRVNEKLHDQMLEHINALIKDGRFESRLILQPDADLPIGDCKIDWGSGGAERNMDAMWREIDAIIERNLGVGIKQPPTGNAKDIIDGNKPTH